MPIIVRFPNGKVSLKKLAAAIGEPAAEKDKQDRLVEIIDNAQSDIASLCNERGCNIPANPTFPQIINGISAITHFTKPAQVTGLRAVGAHDTANIVDLLWSNPSGDKNFTGVKILYKTGSYPSSPTDGTVAYDGAGSSVSLNNMTNGTTYYFRAFAYGSVDGGVVYNDQTTGAQCTGISTLNAPSQVTGLTATAGSTISGYVKLTWSNPSDSKFKGVKILYKTGGYPTTVNDGTVLCTGTGTSVEKTGLTNGTAYYFRAFSYNLSNGIYSYNTGTSGAQCSEIPYISKGQQVFTSSGAFTVPPRVSKIDVFLVGGGGSGSASSKANGGGGGYTKTLKSLSVIPGQQFSILIGAGGQGGKFYYNGSYYFSWKGRNGGSTSFVGNGQNIIADGGIGTDDPGHASSKEDYYLWGGSGGSGGGDSGEYDLKKAGKGGSDGSNGYIGHATVEALTSLRAFGQHTTTRAFGEASNTLYAGGGAGGNFDNNIYVPARGGAGGGGDGSSLTGEYINQYVTGKDGTPNTGGGGGGGSELSNGDTKTATSGNGGSGIAIVRWGY